MNIRMYEKYVLDFNSLYDVLNQYDDNDGLIYKMVISWS